jgi:integrase
MGTSKFMNTSHPGVRYRFHPTRKHGVQRDKYFTIRYYVGGKRIEEGVGWASQQWTAKKAAALRTELQNNVKKGEGPRTLAEKRDLGKQEREKVRRAASARAKLEVSFKSFFDDTFMPDAETRWTSETARKSREHVKNWIDPVTRDTPIKEIDLAHVNKIRAALAKKNSSPRQQQYVFRTFAMVWDAAMDYGLVDGPSPTKSKSFKLPKVDNERLRYLSAGEESKLLEKIKAHSEQAHNIAIVAIDGGLRFKEIASLTWDCVDLEGGVMRVLDSKGRDRYVPMTDRLKDIFGDMQENQTNSLVFPNGHGNRQTQVPSSFVRAVADAELNDGVENKKMRTSFHTLRHTYASRMVQAGVDLYRVQRLLGHSTPIMTARYSKLADDDLKQAVQAMEQAARVNKHKGKVVPIRKRKPRRQNK